MLVRIEEIFVAPVEPSGLVIVLSTETAVLARLQLDKVMFCCTKLVLAGSRYKPVGTNVSGSWL